MEALKAVDNKISIHVPREGDDSVEYRAPYVDTISIHVPREGDDLPFRPVPRSRPISIHVPREGDDWDLLRLSHYQMYFNPRPP